MKKTVFQKKIKNILYLKNFFPLCARIEKLKTIKGKIQINFIFSRAFSDLKSSILYISDFDEKITKSLFLKKIESSNKEFSSSLANLNDFKYKIKVLVKIDKKSKGRMLVMIEKSNL
ncbi:hypothetical protein (nucleomorph) [Guillardia theta]|uniref:Uncharacterized protein n=1 Tax=Guillardia theta TaxID=55529 RepID=Q98SB4_GUITH|nr:hypothetical protein GTHECHR3025 [Guillardia theta]AAK39669.1 hypothetical protein [Guillardia theta]